MKTHRFADPERFRALQKTKREANERRRKSMAAGTGSPRQHLRRIVEDSLHLAGIALILESGDDAVRECFAAAAGGASIVVQPQPSPPANAGWMGWTVSDFNMAVDTLIAFGESGDARQACTIPEAGYRSPEVISENAAFAEVAAKKAWLSGNDAAASTACRTAINQAKQALYRTSASALMALIEGDTERFSTALGQTLAEHRAIFSRATDRADGAYSLRAVMLARIARTYGVAVDEAPYLPIRFLAAGVVR